MDNLAPSDLKTIMHSKRANIYYLQYCRVLVNGGRVEYVTDEGKQSLYWNIPIANTTTIMLGTGTSITQSAVRELSKAGVMIGFCGGGGTPLYAASDRLDVLWFAAQGEYRPTEYVQKWVTYWFDDNKRLKAAKFLQTARLQLVLKTWTSLALYQDKGFKPKHSELIDVIHASIDYIESAQSITDLLTEEGRLTKKLYRIVAQNTNYGDFKRIKAGGGGDPANSFLDHGNYLAYGLGATAAWVLGLPHGFAVLHGKTRRGGLVFDFADLIKDAYVLPQAFISGAKGDEEQEFRTSCIELFTRNEALDFIIETAKELIIKLELDV